MTIRTEITSKTFSQIRPFSDTAIRCRGVGVLAFVCGGLFEGQAGSDTAMVERLSRGVPLSAEGVRPRAA